MRSRNENSRYRQKRGEALAGNFEKKYGSNFGVRSELKMDALKKPNDDQLLTTPHEEEPK
ncbi:hypothetical protein MKY14_02185 [Paenibacillus sp. FSL R5-0887]|uniref:hypothetical protein n=1 Tax=Paenibacillus TaxID=44249 RepID=UPI00096D5506|nr:hypothetical protein [Paenibacillus odorifer]OMC75177.1 hypothetical protein BK121_04030 [Paenibacillus odorifer]OMC78188.1 hypothetical protein BK125_11555 [Paenibacillus odorifer]OMD95454.1 hypothetical protein BSK54_26170 [Paenibacillus odorifer]OME06887.1 hypothetical protein BSK64_09265 [Paenibacillus odorifer]